MSTQLTTQSQNLVKDADYIFYELTRSICPGMQENYRWACNLARQQGLYAKALPRAWSIRIIDIW